MRRRVLGFSYKGKGGIGKGQNLGEVWAINMCLQTVKQHFVCLMLRLKIPSTLALGNK